MVVKAGLLSNSLRRFMAHPAVTFAGQGRRAAAAKGRGGGAVAACSGDGGQYRGGEQENGAAVTASSSPVSASWRTRLEVLLGAARAIEYLHRGADPLVIHRNVSSSNILLDASWTPRLSGFGSAVFQEAGREHGGQPVGEVMGTFGYIDPAYSYTTHISPASDVYSFGVVMLEALTGRPPVIYGVTLLVDSTLPNLQSGKLRDVLDRHPALQPTPRQLEALDLVAQTAIRCLCPRGHNRLAMSEVVANLQRALEIIRNNEPMPWGRASLI
ncbi:putative serine/threonine-protein kinase-like protein CCR3 [Triticum aestivum]|uniref:putative serine/threonine-protein kinase-like protein CCR3 n=1 Tax=Triticum aestivum TaxID=4565 RepID=UPI001D02A51C|nr:putative serine/threonine-protein kinase-like protein CCR3 [Triticum aestivum]